MNVVIGTPVYRQGAHILEKFLANQQQIQQNYPSSELVFATSEYDFVDELQHFLVSWKLRGNVISYEVEKPSYARSKIWNIVCGREAIRKHVLSQTDAGYLLFLDADMTFDPAVISIMEQEIQNRYAVFSGYPMRYYGVGLAGCGCVMLRRSVLEKLEFRCYEFKNGEVVFEDNVLETDLFKLGSKVKRGFFVSITHYTEEAEGLHIEPQPLSLYRKIVNNNFIRYVLIRLSIAAHYNIPWHIKGFLSKSAASRESPKS